MTKTKSRHARRMDQLANGNPLVPHEGKWVISFVFDGKVYKKSHQLSTSEIKHMKDLCREYGDEASQQIIWRAAIKGVGTVSENVMAQAGLDYVKAHYQGPAIIGSVERSKEDYNTLAVLEGFVEERKPLVESEAFDETAAAKVQESILRDQL